MKPKTKEEITIMRAAGRMLAEVIAILQERVAVGMSGADIDAIAEAEIRKRGCIPAFKGYAAGGDTPFPATICFSLNDEIVHGVPMAEKVIAEGDLVKIDIGLIHEKMYADMARTIPVGTISDEAQKILDVTRTSFNKGLAHIKDGATLQDYASAVQSYAESHGCGVVESLVGHGIGYALHEAPQIPNYFTKGMPNFTFRSGMTVALEPMVNLGTPDAEVDPSDGWTIRTTDGSLSAHWENTVLVTDKGTEILTQV